jgi:hypothetical protein
MQPPPPTGWTGNAPPGVDGPAGAVDSPDEVADVVITVIAVMSPTAKTSAAKQIHHAATVLAGRSPIALNCSYLPRDAQNPYGTPTHLQVLAQLDHMPPSQIHASSKSDSAAPSRLRDSAERGRGREEQGLANRRCCLAPGDAVGGSSAYNRS